MAPCLDFVHKIIILLLLCTKFATYGILFLDSTQIGVNYSGMSIRKKLLVIFILVAFLPTGVITTIAYYSHSGLISSQISLISSNAIEDAIERTNYILKDIKRISETFIYQQSSSSNTILAVLKKFANHKVDLNDYNLLAAGRELKFVCESLLFSHDYINGIYIFTAGGNSFFYSKGYDLKYNYDPTDTEWYKKTLEMKGKLYAEGVDTKSFIINSKPSMAFSQALYDYENRNHLGVLLIDCNLNIFRDIDRDILPDITKIILVNEHGKILYANDASRIGSKIQPEILQEIQKSSKGNIASRNGDTILYDTFPAFGWKLIVEISSDLLIKEFNRSRNFMAVVGIIFILLSSLLAFLLSGSIAKPIIHLSNLMKKSKTSNLLVTDKYLKRKDEIGVLYHQYNQMIDKINTYIKERYQNRIIVLDSQMKALEAQINSHFLYNTLECINSIAEIEEVESIALMSKALGDMFRYSIKTESELVTLDEELSHVRNYISIQNIRFGDKIQVIYDIPENLLEEKILKLIIQPLVENAYYHGLENKSTKGVLIIKAVLDGNLIRIFISDNGAGIARDHLEELRNLLQKPPQFSDLGHRTKQSIGLKNIQSRIQLYYGRNYGITVESAPGQGTEVQIFIPRMGRRDLNV